MIKQLSYYLNQSNDIVVASNQVCFNDPDKQNHCILEHDNRIVKMPGFDILIHNISNLHFKVVSDKLYIAFKKGNNDVVYYVCNISRKEMIEKDEEIEAETL